MMEPETSEQYLERVRVEIELAAEVRQSAFTTASRIAKYGSPNIDAVDLAQRILGESRREG